MGSISVDNSGALKKIADTKKALQDDMAKVLAEALTDAKAEISIRTQGGRGPDGPLKKYSKDYAAYRATKGYSTKVNLTVTGRMLDSIQVKVVKQGKDLIGSLYFLPGQAEKARFNQALRNFFQLSKSQFNRITKRVKDHINGRR